MSISHESVHEWWDGSRIDDSERLEVANSINDNSILEKAYNDLTQEQQDLVLNAYYQKQDYYNPNEEEELGVMSDHGSEDKGWTSYPAGTLSGRPLSRESQASEEICPNCGSSDVGDGEDYGYKKDGEFPHLAGLLYQCNNCGKKFNGESKANEYWASTIDDNFKSIPNGDWGDYDNEAICNHCGGKFTIDEIGTEGLLEHLENDHGISEAKADEHFRDPTLFLNEPVANRQELWDREVERYEYVIKLMSTMPPYEKPSKYDFMRGAIGNDEIAEAVWNMKQALGESKANEDYLDDLGYDYAEPTYQQKMDARSVVTKNFSIVQKQTSVPEYGEDQWEYGSWDTFSEDYNMKCNICGRAFDTDADKNGVAEQHLRSEHSIDAFGVSHKQFKESYNPMAFINKQLGIKTKAKEVKIERDDGSIKIDGKDVIKVWETMNGWYHYAIEDNGKYIGVDQNGDDVEAHEWFGYTQGDYDEWGYFDSKEFDRNPMVWEVPKSNWAWTGRESYAKEDVTFADVEQCPECNGTGEWKDVVDFDCPRCNGTGQLQPEIEQLLRTESYAKEDRDALEKEIVQWMTLWNDPEPTATKLKEFLISKGYGESVIDKIFDQHNVIETLGESKANEDDLMRGFFPKDEDYKTYQRSMDKALGLKSVDSHYKSDGITCGICGETPSDKREHLRKHYGAYFDETVASESYANEWENTHKFVGDRHHTCMFCGMKFKGSLVGHIRKNHTKEEFTQLQHDGFIPERSVYGESKANEEVTFAGRGELITQQDVWDAMSESSRVELILEAGWGSDSSMFDIKQFAKNDKFPDGLGGWDVEHMKRIAGLESKASEYGDPLYGTWDQNGWFFGITDLTRDDYEGGVYWKGVKVEHYDHDAFQSEGWEEKMRQDAITLVEKIKRMEADGKEINFNTVIGEAVRGKWNNWKKQDADVRDETLDFADVNADVRADIVDMTLDDVKEKYPEEYEKLIKTGVWGLGESKATEKWNDDEWFAEIEKLASGSGVKRTPVENFLATIDNNDSIVQAEMNFVNDAEVYGWNEATRNAILQGITKYFSHPIWNQADEHVWDNKTFTCSFCGKVGTDFSEMAKEICQENPPIGQNGHQIPLFGDQVKPANEDYIPEPYDKHFEWKASMDQDDYLCKYCGQQMAWDHPQYGRMPLHTAPVDEILKVVKSHLNAHSISESKANEDYDYRTDWGNYPAPDSMDKPYDWWDGQGEFIIDTVKDDLYQVIKDTGYNGWREATVGVIPTNYGEKPAEEWEIVKARQELEREGKIQKGNAQYRWFQTNDGKDLTQYWWDRNPSFYWFDSSLDLDRPSGWESKANEKTGYRKRPTGYGTYVYEEKSKINCQNCGKEIYETDGDTFHTTKCRYCGHVNLTNDLTYESEANEEFREEDHPRDGGKFTSKGSGSSKDEEDDPYDKRPKGADGQRLGKSYKDWEKDGYRVTQDTMGGIDVTKNGDSVWYSQSNDENLDMFGDSGDWDDTAILNHLESGGAFDNIKKQGKEVAEKLAYYFNRGEKPIDWTDNQVSNEAEKILQETYGITTKKPEVAKEVAHESHSPTQEKIIDRKLAGVKSDGIVHELMLWENMSEEQATKAVESTEIPVMDSVSFSLFNRKYSELTEVERQEIKLYGGEAKKVNKSREGV